MKLLHIDSSILGTNSVSRTISAAAVNRLRLDDPSLKIVYRDLTAVPLPHLTLAQLSDDHPLSAAVPASEVVPEEKAVSQTVLAEFIAADILVIGAPMYNFTIPSQLKAWVDRILIPGKTFQYSHDGVTGLTSGKRVIVAISRGGFFGAGTPDAVAEHAESYLRAAFGFIGITPEFIVAEGVQRDPENRKTTIEAALKSASQLHANTESSLAA